jgi:hypothetical protein
MIAYLCNICGAWVIPGVSIDDLADHLMGSIDCREYFQQLEDVKVYKVWQPEQHDRIFLVFARSAAEALERCRRGEAEFYHSPIQEHLWSNWQELSGAYVWIDEELTQGYEEGQAYEREYRETPGGTGGQGHVGVPGM